LTPRMQQMKGDGKRESESEIKIRSSLSRVGRKQGQGRRDAGGGLLACVDARRAAVTRAAALSLVLVVVGGRLWDLKSLSFGRFSGGWCSPETGNNEAGNPDHAFRPRSAGIGA